LGGSRCQWFPHRHPPSSTVGSRPASGPAVPQRVPLPAQRRSCPTPQRAKSWSCRRLLQPRQIGRVRQSSWVCACGKCGQINVAATNPPNIRSMRDQPSGERTSNSLLLVTTPGIDSGTKGARVVNHGSVQLPPPPPPPPPRHSNHHSHHSTRASCALPDDKVAQHTHKPCDDSVCAKRGPRGVG
jgi:hypothetical protein